MKKKIFKKSIEKLKKDIKKDDIIDMDKSSGKGSIIPTGNICQDEALLKEE